MELLNEAIDQLSNPLSGPRELALDMLYDHIESDQANDAWITETLLPALLANLELGLGEEEQETVFVRSFSTLVLAAIVERDKEADILSLGERQVVDNAICHYLSNECDYRGYVDDTHGWAHSLAHVADLCAEIFKNPRFSQPMCDKLLTLWIDIFHQPTLPLLCCDEEQRFAHAMKEALQAERFDVQQLSTFFDRLLDDENELWFQTAFQKASTLNRFTNIRNLTNALYLQCQLDRRNTVNDDVLTALEVPLRRLDAGFYR